MKFIKKLLAVVMVLLLNTAVLGGVKVQADTATLIINGLSVDKQTAKSGDTVTFTINTSGDISNIKSGGVYYKLPSGNTKYIQLNIVQGKLQGKLKIEHYSEPGTWIPSEIYVADKQWNYSYVYNSNLNSSTSISDGYKDLSAGNFQVQGTTADTKSPELKGKSIDKNIAYAGDKVTLTLDVTDDVSGINYVDVTYQLPSGNSKYLQFKPVDGKYQASISITKYSEPGTWEISYVSLSDNAENYTTIYNSALENNGWENNSQDFSELNLEVKDTTVDDTAPVFNSITVDKKTATTGDKVTFTADITDDISGISNIYVNYQLPSGSERYCPLYLVNGKYAGTIEISKYSEAGLWKIADISVQDKAENYLYLVNSELEQGYGDEVDLSDGDFTVKGTTSDSKAPELKSYKIDRTSAVAGNKINFTLTASDNLSGVKYAYVEYLTPSGNYRYIDLDETNLKASLSISKYTDIGTWKVLSIGIGDNAGNHTQIYNSELENSSYQENQEDLSSMDFEVKGNTIIDTIGPEFKSISVDNTSPSFGQKVKVTVEATDDLSGVDYGYVEYITPYGEYKAELLESIGSNKYQGQLTIDSKYGAGTYQIYNIDLYDKEGNQTMIFNSNVSSNDDPNATDLSSYDINVSGTVENDTELTISEVTPKNSTVDVQPTNDIIVYFSEAIQKGTKFNSIALKDDKGKSVKITPTISDDTKSIAIKPSTALSYGTTYTIYVPAAAVKDDAGNTLKSDFTSTFTTIVDDTAPAVLEVTPKAEVSEVSPSSDITLSFNEAIQSGTKFNSIALKDSKGKSIKGTPTISTTDNKSTITIKPSTALSYGTKYTIYVPATAIKDAAGNALKSDFISTFTTIVDNTAPTVLEVTPKDAAVEVSPSSGITVSFSEAIQSGTKFTSIALKDGKGKSVKGTPTISEDKKSITIKPSTSLSYGATYTVYVPTAAVKDAAGNALKSDFTSTFTTIVDNTAPAVTSTSPVDKAENIQANSTITVKFSETIQSGKDLKNISLKSGKNIIKSTIKISEDTLTIQPQKNLEGNQLYVVTIPKDGIKDLAGNSMESEYGSSFTTGNVDKTPPTVVSTEPANIEMNSSITVKFSEAIEKGSKFSSITLKGGSSTVGADISIDNDILIIKPKVSLDGNKKYTVTIPASGVKDLSENNFKSAYSFTFTTEPFNLTVTSSVFSNNEEIPVQYSMDGGNTSLPVSWNSISSAKSYALIMYDPDANNFIHWAVTNIPSGVTSIDEGISGKSEMPGKEFTNNFGEKGYGGPQPPKKHKYKIAIYALNVATVNLSDNKQGVSKSTFDKALAGKVICTGELNGTFDPVQ